MEVGLVLVDNGGRVESPGERKSLKEGLEGGSKGRRGTEEGVVRGEKLLEF